MADASDSLIFQLRTLYAETDALFAGWSCAQSGQCCRFSVTGRQPELWPIEWRLLHRALRARPAGKASQGAGDCPAFDSMSGRCRAYDARPFGCRTHFCANVCAASKNPRQPIRALSRRLADLAAHDDPRAVLRPLLTWQRGR
jgi:hypothetical protein